jgi:membrane-bound serine protease (ClpP class)
MSSPQELFLIFVVVGLLLLALEVIVPGGILGAFAGLSLVGAMLTGFIAFGAEGGLIAAFGVVVLCGVILAMWIKVFPDTPMGRVLTLRRDEKTFRSSDITLESLSGKGGVAQTKLRPGGIALIDGHRADVVSESGYIDAGATIKVVRVEGNRIVVRAEPS